MRCFHRRGAGYSSRKPSCRSQPNAVHPWKEFRGSRFCHFQMWEAFTLILMPEKWPGQSELTSLRNERFFDRQATGPTVQYPIGGSCARYPHHPLLQESLTERSRFRQDHRTKRGPTTQRDEICVLCSSGLVRWRYFSGYAVRRLSPRAIRCVCSAGRSASCAVLHFSDS